MSQKVTVDPAGTVHADGLVVPPSDFLGSHARRKLVERLTQPAMALTGGIPAARDAMDAGMKPILEQWRMLHPSSITPLAMNGVPTDVILPEGGVAPHNARRVLISLHGGGYFCGAGAGALVEAVPVSGVGRIKVVSVDYRMAPENRFPAASEDVEQVYRKLLEEYPAENIGIYGGSAGGTLTAQSLVRFQQEGLPRPSAIGIFGSGLMPRFWFGGDSLAFSYMMNGRVASTPEQIRTNPGNLYLEGIERADPRVTPGLFPDVLARFPPTMIVTGTRDNAMSNALVTNVALLKAGVETQLLVLEGIGHCEFNTMAGVPEAADAFALIWRFFERHLAR